MERYLAEIERQKIMVAKLRRALLACREHFSANATDNYMRDALRDIDEALEQTK